MDTSGGTRVHTETDNGSDAADEIAVSKKRPRQTYPGLCPLCGVTKEINQTGNHRAFVIASQADPDTGPLFERHGVNTLDDSFRVCKPCSTVVLQAISCVRAADISWKDYLDSMMQGKTTKHPAKSLPSALTSQGQPLIALFKSIASGQRSQALSLPSKAPPPPENLFNVGDVELPTRMQPNVNKEGGRARVQSFVCKSLRGSRVVLYTVKFIIGGRVQKDVEQSLLTPSPTADSTGHSQKKRRSKGAEAVLFLPRT